MWYIISNGVCVATCDGEPNMGEFDGVTNYAIESDLSLSLDEAEVTEEGIKRKVAKQTPFIELQKQKWSSIKTIRDTKERSPLPYLGKLFDFDSLSSERLTWLISSARTALTLGIPLEIEWTCYDNSIVLLSANDIIGIPLAVAMRSNELHTKARGYRVLIDSATSTEELEAIVWLDDI